MWVLPWSLNTPAKIDQVIQDAVRNGQNELLVEVRYRSDALYTQNRLSRKYPNPEYRSYILADPYFDPLAYALSEGHRYGLSIQAWVVVFNATPTAQQYLEQSFIYRNRRGWLSRESGNGRSRAADNFGYFIDPGIPEAQEHIKNVICDIASGYPELDGIHLDYIRYPNASFGHHPVSLGRYYEYRRDHPELTWNDWRIMQVTNFVEALHAELESIDPEMVLTAAVFADYNEAVVQYAQAWRDWLDRGIVDKIYPMHYHKNDNAFLRILDDIAGYGHTDKIVMGIRAWDAGGGSLVPSENPSVLDYDIVNVLDRINWIRDRAFPGIALFSYDGLIKGNGLDYLGQRAYQPMTSQDLPPEILALFEDAARQHQAADIAPDLFLTKRNGEYLLNMSLPWEGLWTIEILDSSERLLWQSSSSYLAGTSVDTIILPDSIGSADVLFFHLYRDVDKYQYIIPVSLENQ